MFSITEIQSQLTGGGARPSQFRVQISSPIDSLSLSKQSFMIMAASIPASTIGSIPVPYGGRSINVAGYRTFQPWQVQVINDEDWVVRGSFERWNGAINSYITNSRLTGTSAPAAYKAYGQVDQYSQAGDVIKTYTFSGMFPTSVGAIQLSWADANQIETFPVVFAIDSFEITGDPN